MQSFAISKIINPDFDKNLQKLKEMIKLIKQLILTFFFLLALTCSFMLFAVEQRTELTVLPIYTICIVVMTITFYGIINPENIN